VEGRGCQLGGEVEEGGGGGVRQKDPDSFGTKVEHVY
jgi:hypothetical protein